MSLQALLKKKQNRLLSKTWRTALVAREIEKNNYHVTGNLQKARDFAFKAARYEIPEATIVEHTHEPMVIFSLEDHNGFSQNSPSMKETGGAQSLM